MNTKLSPEEIESIKGKFSNLFAHQTEEDKYAHDELILMANFISEIERCQTLRKINRKQLALDIGTSPSYLTQVFRGNKPLNFYTLAKIQEKLNIKFRVSAELTEDIPNSPHSDLLEPNMLPSINVTITSRKPSFTYYDKKRLVREEVSHHHELNN